MIVDRLSALPDAKPIEFCNGTVSDEVDGFTQWAVTQTAQSLAYATTSFNYKNPQHNYSVRSDLDDHLHNGRTTAACEARRDEGLYDLSGANAGEGPTSLRLRALPLDEQLRRVPDRSCRE